MLKDPGKLRLWRIAELLYRETDERNMLSAVQINKILSERYGLDSCARYGQCPGLYLSEHRGLRFLVASRMGESELRHGL